MRRALAAALGATLAWALLAAGPLGPSPAMAETALRVMSYNIWGGGMNQGEPIDETVAAIRAARADIIGVQETRREADPCTADACPPAGPSVVPAIAAALGYHHYEQMKETPANWSNAVLSRYPIKGATANDTGVEIDVEGRRVFLFNVHLDDAPYQPYQFVGIEYGAAPFLKTEAEAVAAAQATRGPALDLLEADLEAAEGAAAVFVTGDFNEPSHRDWTEAAAKAGRHPIKVAFPTTLRIEALGFLDAYRAIHADEVAKPAFTWTPTSEPTATDDHHDRIDFVFARGPGLVVTDAAIVGEKPETSEIVVAPWPSDHRAVVAGVTF
jgi:endonuclease/exonuclease/phosphatase family metal-dependent hydrolase